MSNDLSKQIIKAVKGSNDVEIIQDFSFNHTDENELLLFFKPESFFMESAFSEEIITMVFDKLSQHNVSISGIAKLSGSFIDKNEIMDRHYGFINRMSKTASTGLKAEELAKLKEVVGLNDLTGWIILGGHEFLKKFPNQTIETLGQFWFSKPSLKVRSGLYAQTYTVEGENVILINGFHPAQLAHLQDENHSVVIVLVHTNTNWDILKNELAGNTFPEKAGANSIRGELFNNKDTYKAEKVTANFNFAHLSAGAFEALFEINNFLSCIPATNFSLSNTRVAKMSDIKLAERAITNPSKEINGKVTDLFSVTEEINTSEAIKRLKEF